jgi:tRNA(Ile2)-agmatinylcytidine synthase
VRIGIDDTDSPEGGCTTWVLTEVIRLARELGTDPIGEPRLVRLNPNVPWKTRGNAALTVRLEHGRGTPSPVGEIDGRAVLAYRRGVPLTAGESQRLVRDLWRRVRELAPHRPGTDPALVASARPLPARLYWNAVRGIVRVQDVRSALRDAGAIVRVRSGRRGIVGASAAIAWPARRRTWELLAYREPGRLGSPRSVDRQSVLEAEEAEPALFLCHDERTRRLLVSPHTPCPILFGLRSQSPSAPLRARATIRSEPVDRWMLFRTNQGTGDHLVRRRSVGQIAPLSSAIVEGVVGGPVEILAGGHVSFALQDQAGESLPCVAFEPTKTLPAVARGLRTGDRLEVWGSRGRTRALRLEGIRVVRLATPSRWAVPRCPSCSRRAHSLGTGRGWRCERCRRVFPLEYSGREVTGRVVRPGVYHPTRSARRHLAPLGP